MKSLMKRIINSLAEEFDPGKFGKTNTYLCYVIDVMT